MLPSDAGIRNGRKFPRLDERPSLRRDDASHLDYRSAATFVTNGAGGSLVSKSAMSDFHEGAFL
jgi:hypothetical protein